MKRPLREVHTLYIIDGTVCEDVEYTRGTINTKIHRETGAGYVKLNGQRTFYTRIERIRVTTVQKRGKRKDRE